MVRKNVDSSLRTIFLHDAEGNKRLEITVSALEQEIVEKFQQLDTSAKWRALAHLEKAVQSSFNYATVG